jgi:hypothetical protein
MLNYLDLTMKKRENELTFNIYRNPINTDVTIIITYTTDTNTKWWKYLSSRGHVVA